MREVAALPLIFITAWEGLVDRAGVRAGQQALVHGGAGGVGHVAIQIARAFGAEVFATGSAESQVLIERVGAPPRSTIDRCRSKPMSPNIPTVAASILFLTPSAVRRSTRRSTRCAALVMSRAPLAGVPMRGRRCCGVFTLLPLLTGEGRAHHGEILRKATRLVEAGKIAPGVDARHFAQAAVDEAYLAIQGGGAAGKIVVDIQQ
jgi:NADPH:quinone reductase